MNRKKNSIEAALRALPTLILLAAKFALPAFSSSDPPLKLVPADLIIVNARIVDGAGNPWYRGSIAVRGDRIEAVGSKLEIGARDTLDAAGLVAAPGFIDIHNHCDQGLVENPAAENFVRQGVTTIVGGPDGESALDLKAYLAGLDTLPLGLNCCFTVGQGSVREQVLGMEDRPPTLAEMERMKALVERAMKDGALGLSTGLKYVPGAFSSTEEVIELAKVAARFGGYYTSHLREEGPGLIEAVAEAIRIAAEAGIPVNITHHKAVGKLMWGKSELTLAMIDSARARGLDVTCDQYPYTATSTGLRVLFPPWSLAGGSDSLRFRLADPVLKEKISGEIVHALVYDRGGDDPLNVVIASCNWNRAHEGKNLKQILDERGVEPTMANTAELVIELEGSGGAACIYHCLQEEDVERIIRYPAAMVASDGTVLAFGDGVPHPRSYGTFPRVLGIYVREKGVIGLEEAVRKMTSLPAQRAGLYRRGILRPGAFADLVLFDPATVADRATFLQPHQYPAGIEKVIVNGRLVFDGRALTEQRPGRVIRRGDENS
ncbi:MAG TPA: D-aminoacylase [Candidatus Glassbacteria bacterium]|nr:D-aminoacylase [Candidatus Glassbacteria bacterium]